MSAVGISNSKNALYRWMKSPTHSGKYDKPEREIIAFSIGFKLYNETNLVPEYGPTVLGSLRFVLPLLLIATLICNLLLIRGMYCLAQWRYPPCIYIAVICFLDLLSVTVIITDLWSQTLSSPVYLLTEFVTMSHAICSSYAAMHAFFSHLRSCLLASFSLLLPQSYLDPLKLINRPRLFSQLRHLLLLLLAILLIVDSNFLWTYSLLHVTQINSPVPPGNYCTYLVKWVSPTFRDVIWPLTNLFLTYLLPFGIMVFVGSSILYRCCPLRRTIRTNLKFNLFPRDNARHNRRLDKQLTNIFHKHMIDSKAFTQLRAFSVCYIYLNCLLLIVPGFVSDINSLIHYRIKHNSRLVTTFSIITNVFTRTMSSPVSISTVKLTRILLFITFPIVIFILALFTSHGFLPKFLIYLQFKQKQKKDKKNSKINFTI